jgi:hypothetical protein
MIIIIFVILERMHLGRKKAPPFLVKTYDMLQVELIKSRIANFWM